MTTKAAIVSAAVSGLVALGVLSTANAAEGGKPEMEKCYGVAKAGKNDCAGTGHACAGQSKKDGDAGEFLSVPKGTCEKLVNGSTTAKK